MNKHVLPLLLLALLLLGAVPVAPARAAPRCFPEAAPAIADCVDGRVASYWEQNGGLPVFGYPIGPRHAEQVEGRSLEVQPFERNRLELHPENRAPYDVLLGRLGAELLARQGRDWTAFPKADPSAPHYFAETGHAIAPQFWGYWSSHGLQLDRRPAARFDESLALFGMPLSEAQVEVSPTDGQPYLTQWFERARFEYHPEHAGTPYEVLLGLLQRELQGGATPAAPAPPAGLTPGGFIQASGGQLTRLGQPIVVKGVNYYPQWRPWSVMWREWDAPQIERELRQARDQLGINAVRLLLPYNYSGQQGGAGQLPQRLLGRLDEVVQIAGSLDMRVIMTLFDFMHDFPAAGSPVEDRHLDYLRTLVPRYAGDERVMAWDVHNEPDNYEVWKYDAPKVVSWLGRMADAIHALAPNQLVTVGMGKASNLWLLGSDGRSALDFSDVIGMHTYDAGSVGSDLDALRARTGKPILVEEFGWPTGPQCVENYTEATQTYLYRQVVTAARGRAAGVVAWTLRDYDPSRMYRWDSADEHFGLYRADGSLKPASQELSAIAAPPLPSATVTHLPLTSTAPGFPDDSSAPLLIPESGHYVKGVFRRAWESYGGRASLGLPLSEAFVRPSDKHVIQFFEGAVLELDPSASGDPHTVPGADKLMQVLRPVDLGAQAAAGRALPPSDGSVAGAFRDFYGQVSGEWRLGGPISAELTEEIGGVPTRVQYFQHGRLELNPATGQVVVGALGKPAWDAQCAAQK